MSDDERPWDATGLEALLESAEPGLGGMPDAVASRIARHPDFTASPNRVTGLITQLRQAASWADLHALQERLLAERLTAEEHHHEADRAATRTQRRKPPHASAPDLPGGADPRDPLAWVLERYMAKRAIRHLRAVGDALAWTALRCERRVIMAYAGNASAGFIDKAGLAQERARMDEAWAQGHFALMTGLTDCLRIDDVIVLRDGYLEPLEVKQPGGRIRGAQAARRQQAIDALVLNGPLPGLPPDTLLLEVPVDYDSHLDLLKPVLDRSERDGVAPIKVPGGRGLIALNHTYEPFVIAPDEARRKLETAHRVVRRRAGITGPTARWSSTDRAGRRPYEPPLGIYPVPPHRVATLICDLTSLLSEVSISAVANALSHAGIHVQIPPDVPRAGLVADSHAVVMRASRGHMEMAITAGNLVQLAAELTRLDVWVEGISTVLSRLDVVGKMPVLVYANEATHWFG